MIEQPASPALTGGIGLLERAINYTLGSLHLVTPGDLRRRTPCTAWDLRQLLVHMNDSLLALHQAVDVGRIELDVPPEGDIPAVDLVATLRSRACQLLGAWAGAGAVQLTSIAGCPLSAAIVTSTGAVEIAVHGWDVAQACGRRRPIPEPLAEELLDLSPLLVTDADRPARFAAPVSGLPLTTAGDRLLAFLGRPC